MQPIIKKGDKITDNWQKTRSIEYPTNTCGKITAIAKIREHTNESKTNVRLIFSKKLRAGFEDCLKINRE